MSGPGDVIAGLAPPQDNAPARNPSGWPYRQAARGRRKAARGERESGEGDEVPGAADGRDAQAAWAGRAADETAAVTDKGTNRYGEEWNGASASGDGAGVGGRFTGDNDSGSGAEGGQEQVAPENMNALAGYIRSSWARNKRARDVVEQRLLACLRARRGVYTEDYTPEVAANARRTVERINAFLQAGGFDGHVNSGWRPPAVNGATKGAAPHSKHMQALACDLFDPGGLIDRVCLEQPEVLERIGLWQETPGSTPGWCHLQIVPPASGHRVFIP